MNNSSIFLDVDPSLVEKNLRFTNDQSDDIEKLFGDVSCPSKVIKPSPGFCVKTSEDGTSIKVFVNICQTDAIPPPKDISVAELEEIIISELPGEYRVPMSIGEIRTEKDKNDQDAQVCDVAIHPKFFAKVEEIQEFKNFFMTLVFQALENKYGLICAEKKVILKNRKAFGTLQMHRIQQREIDQQMKTAIAMSPVEELKGDVEGPKKVMIETISSTENIKEPEYRLFKKKDGHNCLYGEFKFPDVKSSDELTLDIGEDRILLEGKIGGYLLDVFIPFIIKQKDCTSSFDKGSKILTVTMPLIGG